MIAKAIITTVRLVTWLYIPPPKKKRKGWTRLKFMFAFKETWAKRGFSKLLRCLHAIVESYRDGDTATAGSGPFESQLNPRLASQSEFPVKTD
jgi:hypothetical protein